jgi:outer membrane protein, multidrug efflux system
MKTQIEIWKHPLVLSVLCLSLSGCMVGPKYQRPVATAPSIYRGAGQSAAATPETPAPGAPAPATPTPISLGDQKWWDVFSDPELQALLRKGIENNFDARIAAERVVQAQAQLGITRSDQFPQLNGTSGFTSQRYAKYQAGNTDPMLVNLGSLGLSAGWNLDFWGQYRKASEQARAQLLAQEWARRATLSTVVMNVASGYFQLRTLDLQLEISQKTLADRRESLKLTRALEAAGADTMLNVREAEELVFSADKQIPDLERQIEQQEDAICTLIGENPHAIARGLSIERQTHLPTIPAGLPSDLLERRPDIREAEGNLIAANAQIGIARAQYFPQISLTGSASTESNALSRLFTGPSYAWSYGPSLTVPIFNAGRIRNNVREAESQQRQYLLTYQQTIATAFRDVSQSLVAYRKYREYRERQEQLAASAQDAAHLSEARFKGGQSTYLEVLTNETTYFSAELDLATARQNEILSLVQLYNALGGGWQQ